METITKNSALNIQRLRQNFPSLSQKVKGKPLVYLGSGATAQKPKQVMDAISNYYQTQNANIHRGVHQLSIEITVAYENALATVQKYLNATLSQEIIFTSCTTESINLVANSFGEKYVKSADEIIISEMEHHRNLLPWQIRCEEKDAVLKVSTKNNKEELFIDEYKILLASKTKNVAVTHVSNTVGTINPVKEITALAHKKNIPVLVDSLQAVPHMKVDVQALDADYFCFSGHKLFGPTGVGVLYGKEKWLNELPPYKVGGCTVKTIAFEKTEYAELPFKFEAGTPHIEGGIGVGAAINYVNDIGLENFGAFEYGLLEYATAKLSVIEGLRILGTAKEKASIISFVIEGVHPLDIATILDKQEIAVRTGHHCTQPLMEHFGIPGTIRVSLVFFNTIEEIDVLVNGIQKAIKMLR